MLFQCAICALKQSVNPMGPIYEQRRWPSVGDNQTISPEYQLVNSSLLNGSTPPPFDLEGCFQERLFEAPTHPESDFFRTSATSQCVTSPRIQSDDGCSVRLQCATSSGSQANNEKSKRVKVFSSIPSMEQTLLLSPCAEAMRDTISAQLRQRSSMLHRLTWLAVTFASPQVFPDLISFLHARQRKSDFTLPSGSASLTDLVSAVERFDSDILTASVLRRIYLAQLYEDFEARIRRHREHGFGSTQHRSKVRTGKVSTSVLDEMTREILPTTVCSEPGDRPSLNGGWIETRKSLQNKLAAAKPWYRLSLAFTCTSAALFPRGTSSQMYVHSMPFQLLH